MADERKSQIRKIGHIFFRHQPSGKGKTRLRLDFNFGKDILMQISWHRKWYFDLVNNFPKADERKRQIRRIGHIFFLHQPSGRGQDQWQMTGHHWEGKSPERIWPIYNVKLKLKLKLKVSRPMTNAWSSLRKKKSGKNMTNFQLWN